MHHTCRDDLNIITDAATARARVCVCVRERNCVKSTCRRPNCCCKLAVLSVHILLLIIKKVFELIKVLLSPGAVTSEPEQAVGT